MLLCHLESYSYVPYPAALARQYALVKQRQENIIPDTLMLLEHPATITLGRKSSALDILTAPEALLARGIAVIPIDRGGEITYHGPGQLVAYPIFDLRAHGQDLHKYLRNLEEVVIRALRHFDVTGERISGLTGVWVGGRKIAAIGIKVSRWVTMHGFALNIDLDLAPLREDIIACGILDRDVTSLAELLLNSSPKRIEVEAQIIAAFKEVFGVSFKENGRISGRTGV